MTLYRVKAIKQTEQISAYSAILRHVRVAIACVFFLLAGTSVGAQEAVPDQNIRLPSVSEYRLPPGDNNDPEPAQGPSDETVPAPAPAQQPAPTTASPPPATSGNSTDTGPQTGDPGVAPAPVPSARQERPSTSNTRPVQQAPAARRPEPQNIAPPPADTNIAEPTGETSPPSAAQPPAREASPNDVPTETAAPAAASTTERALPVLPIGLGIAALLIALAMLYFWKRRGDNERQEIAAETAPIAEPEPAGEAEKRAPVAAEPRKPAPKIYSPPDPAAEPEPSSAAADGFITTKVGLAPTAAAPKPKTPAPAPASKASAIPVSEDLQIEFIASEASSTLMNAVVGYRLIITNQGDTEIKDIAIFADLVQADRKDVVSQLIAKDIAAHEITIIASGEKVELSGDLRLPLNVIQPISFNQQALFIPMARVAIEYKNIDNGKQSQSASYIVGQEHQPPRPKMAPFRLDLGPRHFGPVGQRTVQV